MPAPFGDMFWYTTSHADPPWTMRFFGCQLKKKIGNFQQDMVVDEVIYDTSGPSIIIVKDGTRSQIIGLSTVVKNGPAVEATPGRSG